MQASPRTKRMRLSTRTSTHGSSAFASALRRWPSSLSWHSSSSGRCRPNPLDESGRNVQPPSLRDVRRASALREAVELVDDLHEVAKTVVVDGNEIGDLSALVLTIPNVRPEHGKGIHPGSVSDRPTSPIQPVVDEEDRVVRVPTEQVAAELARSRVI